MTCRPRYAPYAEGEAGFRIGLQPLDPAAWIEPDGQAKVQFANKADLLANRHDAVVATLPGSEAAQRELLALLVAHLLARFPDLYARRGNRLAVRPANAEIDIVDESLAAIDRAGQLVQEDLCLMQMRDGAHVLTAASLCAPSVWSLADKFGKPLLDIHEHVPGFADLMASRIERIFAHLKADAPVWRTNWSVMTEPTLFLPGRKHDRSDRRLVGLDARTAGDKLFLRVERQTLSRLPESGAIVFTIKTHIDKLAAIAGQGDLIAGLKQAIMDMPPGMAAYKAMTPLRSALIGWLDNATDERPFP